MAEVTITVNDDGSYKVEGGVRVVDAEGNEFRRRDTVWLCRCGGSARKPFCDSTHEKNGFRSAPRATPPAAPRMDP